jgi:hypothetical protein
MWVLPTRSRPSNCLRFIEAWHKTQASTPVYVRIDNDDPTLDELLNLPWPKEFKVIVGPREGLRAAMQELYVQNPSEPWYGLLADDLVPRTEFWDTTLVKKAGTNAISYPNDLGGKPKCPTHPVVGGNLVRATGWFGFPIVQHLYVDAAWQVIGEGLKKLYRLEDVIVEHVHPFWKKTSKDKIYVENKKRAVNDKTAFLKWREGQAPTLVLKLKKEGF